MLESLIWKVRIDKACCLICKVDKATLVSEIVVLILSYYNVALFEKVSPVFLNTRIVKIIWLWNPFVCEYMCRLISIVNILHVYFSLLTLYVHSNSLILRYRIISNYILHPMICLRRYSNCGLAIGFYHEFSLLLNVFNIKYFWGTWSDMVSKMMPFNGKIFCSRSIFLFFC